MTGRSCGSPDESVRAVQAAVDARQFEEAMTLCEAALTSYPDSLELIELRMYLRDRALDYGGALADADRLVALQRRPMNYSRRAGIKISLRGYEGARDDLLMVLSYGDAREREYFRSWAEARLSYVDLQLGLVEEALELARGLGKGESYWADGGLFTREWIIEEGERILAEERGEQAQVGEPNPGEGEGSR